MTLKSPVLFCNVYPSSYHAIIYSDIHLTCRHYTLLYNLFSVFAFFGFEIIRTVTKTDLKMKLTSNQAIEIDSFRRVPLQICLASNSKVVNTTKVVSPNLKFLAVGSALSIRFS